MLFGVQNCLPVWFKSVCYILDVGRLFGGFCFSLFSGKIYVCMHTPPPAQKIKKADLQRSLVGKVSSRIKLESQDYLLNSFPLEQQYSNQIQWPVSDIWSPNVSICWNCLKSAFLLYIFMVSADAARSLAVMLSLYLHRDLTSVIILFCFSLEHESNAYSVVWQVGGVTVETEDPSYNSNPLLVGTFISVELIITKRFFSDSV